MAYRNYNITNGFTVSLDGTGDFTSINDAITAAPENTVIGIKPGIYGAGGGGSNNITKNLTICGMPGAGEGECVVLQNRITLGDAGSDFIKCCISNIYFDSTYDFSLVLWQSSQVDATYEDCYFKIGDIACIVNDNSNASTILKLQNCDGDIYTSNGVFLIDSSPCLVLTDHTRITNTGFSTVKSTKSAGFWRNIYSNLNFPIETSSTGGFQAEFSRVQTQPLNVTSITFGGSGQNIIYESIISSGISPTLYVSNDVSIVNCSLGSLDASYMIAGTGIVYVNEISVIGTQDEIQNTIIIDPDVQIIGTLKLITPLSHLYGGTDITSPGASGNLLVSDGTNWTSSPATGSVSVLTDIAINTAAVVNHGYAATAALTLSLPASPSQGDTIQIICSTAGAVVVQANTGQFIKVGSVASSSAGTATSTALGDVLNLRYRTADTTWRAVSSMGNWSLA